LIDNVPRDKHNFGNGHRFDFKGLEKFDVEQIDMKDETGDNRFNENEIYNNSIGFYLNANSNTLIKHNRITGNTSYAMMSNSANSVDVTCNWWGAEAAFFFDGAFDGVIAPYLIEDEAGDAFSWSAGVQYTCSGFEHVALYDDSGFRDYYNLTIQAAIDYADPGDLIKIAAGTYLETVADTKGIIFSPGTSPGCVTVTGSFTVIPATTFDMEITGTDVCDDYDQVAVTGNLDITDSTLNVILDGYMPELGSQFVVFTYGGSLTGVFSDILVDGPSGVAFTISYTGGEIVLTTSDVPTIPLPNWTLYVVFLLLTIFVSIRLQGRLL